VSLSELVRGTRRLALVGLAKNTGKTEALAALLRELESEGRRVGVTSLGRDGEEHDVIDSRIEKPRVRLPAGSLVATTDTLLRASAIPHQLLEDSGVRTPVGRVLVARLDRGGAIEIAGPSAAAELRAVADAMLALGADQVLIDGAIDRRAASSPRVADGLVVATGAVLDLDIAEVVSQTRNAVELVRLPCVDERSQTGRRLRELASMAEGERTGSRRASLLVGEGFEHAVLPPRFVLTADSEQISKLLDATPSARWLIVAGALPESFLSSLLDPVRRRELELVLIVADPTRVFLGKRGPEWYRRRGLQLQTLERIELEAMTVNPVAPQSHRFDSAQLQRLLAQAIPDVPIFDVLDPDYPSPRRPAPAV
jgi:hypothetical protein